MSKRNHTKDCEDRRERISKIAEAAFHVRESIAAERDLMEEEDTERWRRRRTEKLEREIEMRRKRRRASSKNKVKRIIKLKIKKPGTKLML